MYAKFHKAGSLTSSVVGFIRATIRTIGNVIYVAAKTLDILRYQYYFRHSLGNP